MGRCEVCPDRPVVEDSKALDHLRVIHPDLYGDGPLYWPDGGVVVIDQTGELPEDDHV